MAALDKDKYEVVPIGITPRGTGSPESSRSHLLQGRTMEDAGQAAGDRRHHDRRSHQQRSRACRAPKMTRRQAGSIHTPARHRDPRAAWHLRRGWHAAGASRDGRRRLCWLRRARRGARHGQREGRSWSSAPPACRWSTGSSSAAPSWSATRRRSRAYRGALSLSGLRQAGQHWIERRRRQGA